MIPTKIHAVLDYVAGILLTLAPWLLGFSHNMPATIIMAAMGLLTLSYSLLTDYEFSVLPMVPFRTHLAIDLLSGLLLICSPWLFGFHDQLYRPFVIAGVFEVIVVLLSKKRSNPDTRL